MPQPVSVAVKAAKAAARCEETIMLVFLPPVVQALIGVVLLAAGVAAHNVILDAFGCLGVAVGGYRWLRKRRDGGAAR